MTTVAIATLGCKVNQFESEALMDSLEQRGYSLVPFGEKADITIINTCTVTHRADFQSRQMARRAVRSNPESLVIVTGCYSQVDPDAAGEIDGVAYLLGSSEKARIPDLLPLMQQGKLPRVQVGDIQKETFFSDIVADSFHRHTRAFLKIQDGCNASCSFCIVPHARGPSRSLSPERVLENLRRLKEKGFKEAVLTGIHIGAYGLDLSPACSLERLLQQVEEEETPQRIRLSSIEPLDFSESLIDLLSKASKICPHVHIPIQSGDDEILKRMNRNYTRSFLSDLIHEIHKKIPEVCIGADVITGFPGETEEKFESTYALIESMPFSYLHVFPFSRRRGTPAAGFPELVDEARIKTRAEELRELGKVKRLSFYRQFLQKELRVLIEGRGGRNKTGLKGVSKNYIPVVIPFKDGPKEPGEWVNQEHAVVVTGVSEMGVTGRAVEMASEEGVVFTPLSEDETEKEFGSDFQRHRISGTDRKAKKRWVDDLSDGLRRNDSDEERLSSLQELEKRLNYRFQEIRWLDQALTHRSFSYETDPSVRVENEVLEFLGDAVLTLAVSHLLIRKFPDAKEGELSKKRSHLVKMSFLAHLSKELQLEDYLLLGKGEVQTGGRKNPSIMANTYEALIGAFYMDAGFNQAFQIIGQHFETYLQQDIPSPPFHDYKSLLQEESQRVHGQSPRYQVLQESGPDHNKRFQASAIINGEVKGVGWGKSKKDAEQEAAKKALDEISANFQASNDNKTLE